MALLQAAEAATAGTDFRPWTGPIGLDVQVYAAAGSDPWDATNYLGGIADVLEVKSRRGLLPHLGALASVALYANDRQIKEVHYREEAADQAGYTVHIYPLGATRSQRRVVRLSSDNPLAPRPRPRPRLTESSERPGWASRVSSRGWVGRDGPPIERAAIDASGNEMACGPRDIGGTLREQGIAASHRGGNARLLAGPGTGKTRTLVDLVSSLIASGDAELSEILCLTFTRAAAAGLRSKIKRTLGGGADPSVYTLHGLRCTS